MCQSKQCLAMQAAKTVSESPSYSLETAGHTDPKNMLCQVAGKADIHPVSLEVRPGQEVLASAGGTIGTPDTRECFCGIFILRTSFAEGEGKRETGCPWPKAPGSSKGQRPLSALC
jgi:hypothetical protein